TKKLHPHIKTIIEMGGEDSKLILLDGEGMKDFSMNSVCAAGTGSFLDQQAERLRLGIEEFSELSLRSRKPPRIAGRCSVFAKSDMIHLQQIATPVEEVVAGLCFAVARNFKGSIARGKSIVPPVSFQGGVAANKGMVRAFREVLELDELFVPPDFALMGALGAGLKAADEGTASAFRLEALEEYVAGAREQARGHPPLLNGGDAFFERHGSDSRDVLRDLPEKGQRVRVYMGIDVGSISTNVAVIDGDGRLLSKLYLMTAGRPIEAVRQGLRETAAELGDRVEIVGVGTTGSGRYMIADFVGADIVKNEITAQATAAVSIDPEVDTIFEIGGQDSKYISLEGGVIVDFEMNKACAAGTGSFLEEQAQKLHVSVTNEFAECAFSSPCPTKLGERCTVFMENSLMANLQRGTSRNDLLAGLAYSIVQNYINRVVAGRRIGAKVFFQGGVAYNKSVVAAFEKFLGQHVTVPPDHEVTGAIGMARIAMQHMLSSGTDHSSFKGFDRVERPYEVSSFSCGGCANVCEINRVKMEGEKDILFYGGRCEKYDINKKAAGGMPDLFNFRDELLWREAREHSEHRNGRKANVSRGTIGIPSVFYFNEYLPFWTTFLSRLGFSVEVSPQTNRQIVNLGLEGALSEACFPVKVAIGHIQYLKERGVDTLLLPSFMNLRSRSDEYSLSCACPHTQSIPYVGRLAVRGVEILAPVVDMSRGTRALADELTRVLKRFGIAKREIMKNLAAAEQSQTEFYEALRRQGREVLAGLKQKAIVIVGRSYSALERGMNLRIPEKIAALGMLAIPMDMLPLEGQTIAEEWPDMYWRSGQRMLRAARFLAGHDKLYPIVIGNFSCGPDSFIMKYFKKELRGKPFLHIELDEHSADAGVITRCEAFLDSIGHRAGASTDIQPPKRRIVLPSLKNRVVYIPPMTDHTYALAAAFERCGVYAEVLPESDRETVELGMKYVSGKECYPCALTTGDMLKKAFSRGFDASRSAFFMPGGSGPCRFGQYNVFHRMVLESVGMADVPILAPNQDVGLYASLEMVRDDFALTAWKGIVAVDLLTKCLHEARPYEQQKGSSDEVYRHHLERLARSLSGRNGRLEDTLKAAKKDFEALPKTDGRKPLIGIIGEIYVRNNRFSNEDLVRQVEVLGGEASLATFGEWIYYLNAMSIRRHRKGKEFVAAAKDALKNHLQTRIEKHCSIPFKKYLRTLHEPSTRHILELAGPYIPDTFEGEAVVSIGKSVDLARQGVSGIINAMPFGCMPSTIAAGAMQIVKKEYDIPFITIPYDGTESSTNGMLLEAFMDQAGAKARTRNRSGKKAASS
ncbi:MAG: CoA protein activase, partial [Nitrospirae bacterium]|nr:CoA protein activase [Nitrospirota bacterium]